MTVRRPSGGSCGPVPTCSVLCLTVTVGSRQSQGTANLAYHRGLVTGTTSSDVRSPWNPGNRLRRQLLHQFPLAIPEDDSVRVSFWFQSVEKFHRFPWVFFSGFSPDPRLKAQWCQ